MFLLSCDYTLLLLFDTLLFVAIEFSNLLFLFLFLFFSFSFSYYSSKKQVNRSAKHTSGFVWIIRESENKRCVFPTCKYNVYLHYTSERSVYVLFGKWGLLPTIYPLRGEKERRKKITIDNKDLFSCIATETLQLCLNNLTRRSSESSNWIPNRMSRRWKHRDKFKSRDRTITQISFSMIDQRWRFLSFCID